MTAVTQPVKFGEGCFLLFSVVKIAQIKVAYYSFQMKTIDFFKLEHF